MLTIKKTDLEKIHLPEIGYGTLFFDKDNVPNLICRTSESKYTLINYTLGLVSEESYLRPINKIVENKGAIYNITVYNDTYRAFCIEDSSIYESRKNKTESGIIVSWKKIDISKIYGRAQYAGQFGSWIIFINGKHYIINEDLSHITDYNNPHEVTKEQVGLGNVVNKEQIAKRNFDEHVLLANNPHIVTVYQIELDKVLNIVHAKKVDLETHLEDKYAHDLTKKQIGLGNVLNIKQIPEKELHDHSINFENPHNVDAASIGLGNVINEEQIAKRDLTNHTNRLNNPHKYTKVSFGLGNVDNLIHSSRVDVLFHISNNQNPHNITKEQVGLGKVLNIKQVPSSQYDDHLKNKSAHNIKSDMVLLGLDKIPNITQAKYDDVIAHVENVSNPHSVTKLQVGLGNLQNIPLVSKELLNQHLEANNPHKSTKKSIGFDSIENIIHLSDKDYKAHLSAKNPHKITKKQIGLDKVPNVTQAKENDYILHVADRMAHGVTKGNIGLAFADNTSSKDKPLANLEKAEIVKYIKNKPNGVNDFIDTDGFINTSIYLERLSFAGIYCVGTFNENFIISSNESRLNGTKIVDENVKLIDDPESTSATIKSKVKAYNITKFPSSYLGECNFIIYNGVKSIPVYVPKSETEKELKMIYPNTLIFSIEEKLYISNNYVPSSLNYSSFLYENYRLNDYKSDYVTGYINTEVSNEKIGDIHTDIISKSLEYEYPSGKLRVVPANCDVSESYNAQLVKENITSIISPFNEKDRFANFGMGFFPIGYENIISNIYDVNPSINTSFKPKYYSISETKTLIYDPTYMTAKIWDERTGVLSNIDISFGALFKDIITIGENSNVMIPCRGLNHVFINHNLNGFNNESFFSKEFLGDEVKLYWSKPYKNIEAVYFITEDETLKKSYLYAASTSNEIDLLYTFDTIGLEMQCEYAYSKETTSFPNYNYRLVYDRLNDLFYEIGLNGEVSSEKDYTSFLSSSVISILGSWRDSFKKKGINVEINKVNVDSVFFHGFAILNKVIVLYTIKYNSAMKAEVCINYKVEQVANWLMVGVLFENSPNMQQMLSISYAYINGANDFCISRQDNDYIFISPKCDNTVIRLKMQVSAEAYSYTNIDLIDPTHTKLMRGIDTQAKYDSALNEDIDDFIKIFKLTETVNPKDKIMEGGLSIRYTSNDDTVNIFHYMNKLENTGALGSKIDVSKSFFCDQFSIDLYKQNSKYSEKGRMIGYLHSSHVNSSSNDYVIKCTSGIMSLYSYKISGNIDLKCVAISKKVIESEAVLEIFNGAIIDNSNGVSGNQYSHFFKTVNQAEIRFYSDTIFSFFGNNLNVPYSYRVKPKNKFSDGNYKDEEGVIFNYFQFSIEQNVSNKKIYKTFFINYENYIFTDNEKLYFSDNKTVELCDNETGVVIGDFYEKNVVYDFCVKNDHEIALVYAKKDDILNLYFKVFKCNKLQNYNKLKTDQEEKTFKNSESHYYAMGKNVNFALYNINGNIVNCRKSKDSTLTSVNISDDNKEKSASYHVSDVLQMIYPSIIHGNVFSFLSESNDSTFTTSVGSFNCDAANINYPEMIYEITKNLEAKDEFVMGFKLSSNSCYTCMRTNGCIRHITSVVNQRTFPKFKESLNNSLLHKYIINDNHSMSL